MFLAVRRLAAPMDAALTSAEMSEVEEVLLLVHFVGIEFQGRHRAVVFVIHVQQIHLYLCVLFSMRVLIEVVGPGLI